MNEEKNEKSKKTNQTVSYEQGQFDAMSSLPKKSKIYGGIPDIIAMLLTYILTGELISSLFSGDNLFSYKTTIIYFLFFITATVYIVTENKEVSKSAAIPGAAALILSTTFALHSTQYLDFVNFLLLIVLSGIYCITLTKSNIHSIGSYFYFSDILQSEMFLPLRHIFTPYPAIIKGLAQRRKSKVGKGNIKKTLPVILGIVFAIPVLYAVIPLLIEGDAAFDSVTKFIFSGVFSRISSLFDRLENIIFEHDKLIFYMIALFVSPYIFSVMFSFRHRIIKKELKDTSKKYLKLRIAPQSFISAFLLVICAVYAVYLLSQTAYLFSAFAGHLPTGMEITVTEYARKGFFEMVKVAVLNFFVIAFTVIFAKRKSGKFTKLIRGLDVFICAFTILLSAISVSKIALYIAAFGYTQKRVYVFVFDIILIITFLCIIIRLFSEKFPYMKVIISSVCAALTVMGLVGIDKFIANRNAELYLKGKIKDPDEIISCYAFPSDTSAINKIACSNDEFAAMAKERLIKDSVPYFYPKTYYCEKATISGDGKISNILRLDNLDEYLAIRMFAENEEMLESVNSEKLVYVCIDEAYVGMLSISVSTETQTCALQNADGSYIGEGFYTFYIDANNAESFTYTIKTEDMQEETYETSSNYIRISTYDDGNSDVRIEVFEPFEFPVDGQTALADATDESYIR